MKIIIAIIISFIALQCSCQNKVNIHVSGRVTDLKGNPISNAEVVVVCWFYSGYEDASIKKQDINTDESGNYMVNFEKGFEIDIASKAPGYEPFRSFNNLTKNTLKSDIRLTKAQENPNLKQVFNTDEKFFIYADTIITPFIKIKFHDKDNEDKLDLGDIKTFGFDMKTFTTTTDTSQADFWFKIEKKDEMPNIIKANSDGGLIPILNYEIKSSLLYEKNIAPKSGYINEYSLTGKEEGLFILCRDKKTYGKIIFEKSSVESSGPDKNGNYRKEYGKIFSCFYQPDGTTNLTNPKVDIDLEDFLTDGRMR